MSAHLTIALTIALAMIVNARIVIARSASMLPAEMMKNLEAEQMPDKMVISIFALFLWNICSDT